MGYPGYYDAARWEYEQQLQLGFQYRTRRFIKGSMSLMDEIGRSLAGRTLELEEGAFFLYAPMLIQHDDITIVGQGPKTEIIVMDLPTPATDIAIRWTGDRGRLFNLLLAVNPALAPRMAQYLLHVEGARFAADLVHTSGGANIVRVAAGANYAKLHRLRISGQSNVGILAEADYHEVFSCEVDASAAASEVDSTGNQSNVLSNWCIGGNISVTGAGSVSLGNQV